MAYQIISLTNLSLGTNCVGINGRQVRLGLDVRGRMMPQWLLVGVFLFFFLLGSPFLITDFLRIFCACLFGACYSSDKVWLTFSKNYFAFHVTFHILRLLQVPIDIHCYPLSPPFNPGFTMQPPPSKIVRIEEMY